MSYRLSSPLGNEVVKIVRAGSGPTREVAEGTLVRDARGTVRPPAQKTVARTASAVFFGTKTDQRDPAIAESRAEFEASAAVIAEDQAKRKKYILIGAVAIGGLAAILVLRRKKKGSTP